MQAIFWKLLLVHAVTDYLVLRDESRLAKWIDSSLGVAAAQALIFSVLSLLLVAPSIGVSVTVGFRPVLLPLVMLLLAITYMLTNALKSALSRPSWGIWTIGIGEAVHAVVFLLASAVVTMNLPAVIVRFDALMVSGHAVPMVLSIFLLFVLGGGHFTGAICKNFLPAEPEGTKPGLVRAGRYIGILERTLVITAIALDRPEFVGYLLVAKSIARYPVISRSEPFGEYYLLGTLTSVSVGCVGGLLLRHVL